MKSEQVVDIIEKGRWLILAVVGIVCLYFLYQLTQLKLNPTPYFIDRTHPSRIAEHRVKQLFTSTGETAIVVLENTEGSIYSADYLQQLQKLATKIGGVALTTPDDIEKLKRIETTCCKAIIDNIIADGLDKNDLRPLQQLADRLGKTDRKAAAVVDEIRIRVAPIRRVRSITSLQTLSSEGDNIDVSDLVSPPYNRARLEKLAAEVKADPQLKGLFVSRDETAAAILVELRIPEDDSLTMIAMHNALMAIAKAYTGPGKIYLGGPPMVTSQTSEVIQHDNLLLTPVVTLIMAAILWWSYRRVEAVLIPLTVAGATTLITLGTMAALGIPLNIVTTVLPVFLISMIIADAVHVLNRYFIGLQTLGHSQALRESFKDLWYPMVFYSVTTMVGFLAMMNTDLTFLKQLGCFVLLGLAVGLLFNLVLLPTLLSAWRTLGASTLDDNRFILWIGQRSEMLARGVIARKFAVLAALVLVTLVSLALASHIKSHNEVIGYFDDDALIKQHEHAIRHLFGGTTPFSLWLQADRAGRFHDPDVVAALEQLQRRIRDTGHVGYVTGLSDYIDNGYRVISGGLPQTSGPQTFQRDSVAQHLFFYENARDRDIRDVVDLDYRNSRLFILADTDNTQLLDTLIGNLKREARQLLPADIKVKVTGFGEILVTSAHEIIGDQSKNVALALLVIWVAMFVLYRSLVLALIAITPLTLSILLNLALMSLLNIPLNIGTALIATVTFGVGIDYAIHIMNNVRNALGEGEQLERAIFDAVRTLASGICINSLAVGLGCLVLVASQYEALQNLGILVASGMIICALVTLVTLPVLAMIAEPAWNKYRSLQLPVQG